MEKQRNYESPLLHWGVPNGLAGKESTLSAGDTGDAGSIPWSGRSPGGGKCGNQPTPVFFLKNLMDKGAWQATV